MPAVRTRPSLVHSSVSPIIVPPTFVSSSPKLNTGVVFPLVASANGHYLQDKRGVPFLVVGDAPQASVYNISPREAEGYLDDRLAAGFNTLWIIPWSNTYDLGRSDLSTYDGLLPFTTTSGAAPNGTFSTANPDVTTLNAPYWARVDNIVRMATDRGFLIFLHSCDCATTGCIGALTTSGHTKCTTYGNTLGTRYQAYQNIIWLHGLDFDSYQSGTTYGGFTSTQHSQAVGSGIATNAPQHLQTVELMAPTVTSEVSSWFPPATVDWAYSYGGGYDRVLAGYNHASPVPVVMGESLYDTMHHNGLNQTGTPLSSRTIFWWAVLSGATGHIYGHKDIWPFSGSGAWQAAMSSLGAKYVALAGVIARRYLWWTLVPDSTNVVCTSGFGTYAAGTAIAPPASPINTYCTTARTADGKLIMSYVPTTSSLIMNMTKCASSTIVASWIDPTMGASQSAGTGLTNTGSHTFTSPGSNAQADTDWLLVLSS